MADNELEVIAQQIEDRKLELEKVNAEQQQTNAIQAKMDDKMMGVMDIAMDNHKDDFVALADKALENELDIRNTQTEGRKKKEKSKVEKEVTEAKTEEDQVKHERAKTILKAMGLVKQLPKIFRGTALVIGYPFFVIYLLTLGWVIEFFSFVIQGFMTLVADCAERFTDLNAKIIENTNNKDFKLKRAIMSFLWGILILGAVIGIIVLLVVK